MDLRAIIDFWQPLSAADSNGKWIHPKDRHLLGSEPHTFNLDFPVSPFIGDILNAPIVILGLNAGFSPVLTPKEFSDPTVTREYLDQVLHPDRSPWRLISEYYKTSNSWRFMASRKAAWINASPYRSPNLSTETRNQRLAPSLASTAFHNRWLREAVLPMAAAGDRLVVVKRKSLWTIVLPGGRPGMISCRSYVGKHLDASVLAEMDLFLKNRR